MRQPPADGSPPEWLTRVAPALQQAVPAWWTDHVPPPRPLRRSAVLVLVASLGPDRLGEVVLTERAAGLRAHAAQVAFPGGHLDPDDAGPAAGAVREAEEEVGVAPDSVTVLAELPPLYMTPSRTSVTPVLGWWHDPHPIGVVDSAEVARVVRADLDDLRRPVNRFTVTGPNGYRGPGFAVDGLFVWGFTANLLSHLLELGGVGVAWDQWVEQPLPEYLLAAYRWRP